MYSKNIILIFCIATYVFHCQGGKPSPKEIEIISNAFIQRKNNQNYVDIDGLLKVLETVAEKSGTTKKIPSIDDTRKTLLDRTLTYLEVEYLAEEFLASQDPKNMEIINEVIKKYEKPNGISFEELKLVINEVSEKMRIHKDFPRLVDFKTITADHRFVTYVIEKIAQQYKDCNDLFIKKIIRNLVRDNQKPNGLSYEQLLHVISEVKKKTDVVITFPSPEELETAYAGFKFTVDQVEDIVNEYLF